LVSITAWVSPVSCISIQHPATQRDALRRPTLPNHRVQMVMKTSVSLLLAGSMTTIWSKPTPVRPVGDRPHGVGRQGKRAHPCIEHDKIVAQPCSSERNGLAATTSSSAALYG